MAILWSVTEAEIKDILDSSHFATGGKYDGQIITWGNRAVTDIAMDIDVRSHLTIDTTTLVFTDSDESITLPTNFLKMSERFTKARIGDALIDIIGLDSLRSFDPAHDQTTSGDTPDAVSVEGRSMFVYPLFNGTVVLENYYKQPTDMADDTKSPDLPDHTVVQDLLIAAVCWRGFRLLRDWDAMRNYRDEYNHYLDIYRRHLGRSDSKQVAPFRNY